MAGTLITTTKGLMDPDELEKREGALETDDERTTWVEFWDGAEIVHRSVAVQMKRWPVFADGSAFDFSSILGGRSNG